MRKKYYSIIDSASLKNPTLLNKFKHLKVTIQYEPESPTAKYHYIFLLEFNTEKIGKIISDYQKEMLYSWYSFFWSKNLLYIVFDSEFFKIDIPSGWSSDIYKAAQLFGRKQKIPEIYLDFKKQFHPYLKMGKK